MSKNKNSDTRHKILDIAENLFAQRGYSSVTLRDIADAVDMKHASLYYHVPGGKKALFVEVLRRSFQRHQVGISDALDKSEDSIRQQLYSVADWLAENPAIDLSKLKQGDGPQLSESEINQLIQFAFDAIRIPISQTLKQSGDLSLTDYDLATMAFVNMIQSVHNIPMNLSLSARKALAHDLVDMILQGWLRR